MKELIRSIFQESIKVKEETLRDNLEVIARMAEGIIQALKNGKKIMFFGNGGSAADSQHMAPEFFRGF